MLQVTTFPAERAEEAIAAARTLVDLSTEQLEICRQVNEELEFTGELPKQFMKRLVSLQSELRKTRARLKQLASTKPPPNPKGGDW
jgi:hypothetical protein